TRDEGFLDAGQVEVQNVARGRGGGAAVNSDGGRRVRRDVDPVVAGQGEDVQAGDAREADRLHHAVAHAHAEGGTGTVDVDGVGRIGGRQVDRGDAADAAGGGVAGERQVGDVQRGEVGQVDARAVAGDRGVGDAHRAAEGVAVGADAEGAEAAR